MRTNSVFIGSACSTVTHKMFKNTLIHEARHTYQNSQAAIAGKDQDHDYLVNSVYGVAPNNTILDSTDTRVVCNNSSASNPYVENRAYHGDNIVDSFGDPEYASYALEEDAYVFASNNEQ